MEIDITAFVNANDPFLFSASQMEMGEDAGKITWNYAMDEARGYPLLTTEDDLQEARDYFGEFGAWDDEERAAWTADEVNALLIQYISGNLREIESLCTGSDGEINWKEVERLEQEGQISGNIYPGDDGHIYFYMGS